MQIAAQTNERNLFQIWALANQKNTKSDIPVTFKAVLKGPPFIAMNIKTSDYFVDTLVWK